jgi:hypothetical protein
MKNVYGFLFLHLLGAWKMDEKWGKIKNPSTNMQVDRVQL